VQLDLKSYSSVRRWLGRVFADGIRSEKTEKLYLHFLGRFCKFVGKDPDRLIEERASQLRSGDDYTRHMHEQLVTEWRNMLESELGLSRSSTVTAMNVVKSFYACNYVPLDLRAPKTWRSRVRRTPTRAEVGLMVKSCRGIRDKAIILFMFQSGVSLGDLRRVTYRLIRDELESGVEPVHIPMTRGKVMRRYDTFIGADTVEALKKYFAEEKPVMDKPVFGVSDRMIQIIVRSASARAGLDPPATPHRLRAAFSTCLKSAGAPDQLVEYWLGHRIPYEGAYFSPTVEDQRRIYGSFEWAVSVGDAL
jgi:integrase